MKKIDIAKIVKKTNRGRGAQSSRPDPITGANDAGSTLDKAKSLISKSRI
jgi:hypothetical protein